MLPKIQTLLTELRRRFEALYGERLVRMVLFGSQARGDAEPGSDIDVLVVLRGLVSPCEEIARTINSVAAAKVLHTEGHHGFAASRAYYAMFYVAEAFLLGKGLAFSKHRCSCLRRTFCQG